MAIEFNIEIQDWNNGEPVVAYMRLSEFSSEDIMFTQVIPATETSEKSVSSIIIPRVYMRAVIERLEAASVLDIRESDETVIENDSAECASCEPDCPGSQPKDHAFEFRGCRNCDCSNVGYLPPCVLAMRCYCAGHARGNPASDPCDTNEVAS